MSMGKPRTLHPAAVAAVHDKLVDFQRTLPPAERIVLAAMLGEANGVMARHRPEVTGYDSHDGFWYNHVWYPYQWSDHFEEHPEFHPDYRHGLSRRAIRPVEL